MTVRVRIPIDDNRVWYAQSDDGNAAWFGPEHGSGPMVCVPVNQLEGMSKAEIGECVLSAVDYAHYARALNLLSYFRDCSDSPRNEYALDKLLWLKDILLPFESWDNRILEGLRDIEAQLARRERRASANASKSEKRREIARNYNDIFVALGQRDGFQCARCGATEKLEIDHIIPLAKNGSNEESNLQLLCSTCNRRKGSR